MLNDREFPDRTSIAIAPIGTADSVETCHGLTPQPVLRMTNQRTNPAEMRVRTVHDLAAAGRTCGSAVLVIG